ncbi:MAG: RNA 2',3'-cyclic phosphodiesterase [Methanobacteriaceae archaeon]|jgi:2'-5' RNA ligase|nr:RNA 2',3'-cyclic phosphodiesterase [Methanobacteriaceae archaeon]
MSSNIRSFLAIEIDENLKKSILNLQNEFKKINTNIKFVNPENMHLTLKFFGDISLDCSKKIALKIEDIIKNYNSFELELENIGSFPNKNYIKVIWIGFNENKTLSNLQKELDNEFYKLKFKKERNYTSHLTIGRVKGPKNKDLVKKIIDENKNIKLGKINVNKISLKKSTLTANGPIYEDLKVFKVI